MGRNLKIFTNNIDKETLNQINIMMEYEPFKSAKVRIMPDTHKGEGSVIGFTATITDKVIPNVVGVDIGCGMLCINLGKINLKLKKFDEGVRREVPAGTACFENTTTKFDNILNLKCYNKLDNAKFDKQIGTLGGGNHFIELDKDNKENVYLIIHTGSRNLGKQVAKYYQELAIKLLSCDETSKIPKELCYLEGTYKDDYLHDMKICQEYAILNRETIAINIIENVINTMLTEKLDYTKLEKFHTIHNYINFEDNIVRKGAISAKKDEIVIIPINMRDGSIIAKGKGNENWNNSAPHGAGRIMSRSKAKAKVSLKEYKETMKNIYSSSVCESTIDESPFAYKPMKEIITNTKDTIEIIKIIKPIYNFKASY